MSAFSKSVGNIGLNLQDLRCDDVFAYEAPRTVRIRNAYIGIFDIMIKLAILGFVVFNLWTGKGVTIFESVSSGAQEASIMDLYDLPSDKVYPGGNYTGLGGDSCKLPHCGRDPATYKTPSYCGQNKAGDDVNGTGLDCLFWSSGKVPVKESESTFFVTSRVTMTDWSPAYPDGCIINKNWSQSCIFNTSDRATKFYIPDVENYSIRMSHSVQGQKIKAAGSTLNAGIMEGTNLTFGSNEYDYFRVADLLMAAGLGPHGLDLIHDLHDDNADDAETNRYAGINIFVEISYFTPNILKPTHIEYKYKVAHVENMGASYKTDFYNENGTMRMEEKRSGVRITFSFNGVIEQFDVLSSLMTLAVGLGMWAISGVIINLIVTRISSNKDIYNHYLYENSQHFSDLHALDQTDPEKMNSIRTFAKDFARHGNHITELHDVNPIRFQPTQQSAKQQPEIVSSAVSSTA